jgi:hypothetical protein
LVLNILSELLRPVKEFEPIIFALILIGAVLLLQNGLIGLVQTVWQKIKEMAVLISSKAYRAPCPSEKDSAKETREITTPEKGIT